ncbi:Nn.00g030770.m01.CDS01 [Neocucurbitaria sp. VM-36]
MSNVNGTITMLPPPEGYVVDFANPRRRLVTETYVLFILENILAIIFLVQRLYTKIRLMRVFQIDDVTVILAWILSVATQGLLVAGFITRCIGVHGWEIPIEDFGLYSRLILAAPLTYAPCCALTKISLCIFYSRLSPSRLFLLAVWTTVFICAGAYTGIFFSLVFACKPIAASWNPLLLGTAVCINRGAIYIATAVIGVVTDVILIALPIPTIWGLQMPMKQKIGLTAIFGIGSITMVTSIVRLVVLLPSLTNPDATWVIAEGSLWIIVEANLFIICCCLPTLRRFFRHVAPRMIGESGGESENKNLSSRNRGLRTWGSGGPKRQFDTLMNTVDGMEGDDYIPLSSTENKAGLNARESKIIAGSKGVKSDNDSEEAILYERTLQVTYGSEGKSDPTNTYTRKIWADRQNNRA